MSFKDLEEEICKSEDKYTDKAYENDLNYWKSSMDKIAISKAEEIRSTYLEDYEKIHEYLCELYLENEIAIGEVYFYKNGFKHYRCGNRKQINLNNEYPTITVGESWHIIKYINENTCDVINSCMEKRFETERIESKWLKPIELLNINKEKQVCGFSDSQIEEFVSNALALIPLMLILGVMVYVKFR